MVATKAGLCRIPRQAYELPEIRLEPDEAAVLGLAARDRKSTRLNSSH